MPISYGTYEKQMKSLPITLHADGTASVTIRVGYMIDEVFSDVTERHFQIDVASVSGILDNLPVPGLTRRDDLSLAIYTYLVTNGLVEPGTVS